MVAYKVIHYTELHTCEESENLQVQYGKYNLFMRWIYESRTVTIHRTNDSKVIDTWGITDNYSKGKASLDDFKSFCDQYYGSVLLDDTHVIHERAKPDTCKHIHITIKTNAEIKAEMILDKSSNWYILVYDRVEVSIDEVNRSSASVICDDCGEEVKVTESTFSIIEQ